MTVELAANSYGKERVRVTRISREGNVHTVRQLTVAVELEGDFGETYLTGDNTSIVATDSMKNTVYVLARNHPIHSIEEFAIHLAGHFINHYAHVSASTVRIEEQIWKRLDLDHGPHPHAFEGIQGETPTCSVRRQRSSAAPQVESGIENLLVLKSTDSLFKDFVRDEYTTLPDADDRIFSTLIQATWQSSEPSVGWAAGRQKVRDLLLATFARHYSLSVQQTLYAMGQAIIEQCDWVEEISFVLPNKHHLPVNLAPFNLDNPNVIFQPTDEPFGQIQGTIRRKLG